MTTRIITAGSWDEYGLCRLEINETVGSDNIGRVILLYLTAEEWRTLEQVAHERNAERE